MKEFPGRSVAASGRSARSRVEHQALIEFLKPIASSLQRTFGNPCEVVIHDFRNPERSIVWIQGTVTGRKAGGSVSAIGLSVIKGGNRQPDIIGYVRNSRDGKIIKATTILLRDHRRNVFGCLCINLDVTGIVAANRSLEAFLEAQGVIGEVHFGRRLSDALADMIKTTQQEIGRAPSAMTQRDRHRFLARLENKGAFAIQRSIPTVAKYLQVSRTTIYGYLTKIRAKRGLVRLNHTKSDQSSKVVQSKMFQV